MFAFIAENIGTILIVAALAILLALAVRSIVKSKKSGGCVGCAESAGGSCPYGKTCPSAKAPR